MSWRRSSCTSSQSSTHRELGNDHPACAHDGLGCPGGDTERSRLIRYLVTHGKCDPGDVCRHTRSRHRLLGRHDVRGAHHWRTSSGRLPNCTTSRMRHSGAQLLREDPRVLPKTVRSFRVLTAARWQRRIDIGEVVESQFRVVLTDLDALRHMTNGKHLLKLDAARMDFHVRTGIWAHLSRNDWHPAVTAQTVDYHRFLHLRERYVVRTRLLGFDGHDAYFQQIFVADDEVCAQGVVSCRYLSRDGGSITHADLAAEVPGFGVERPLPDWVNRWVAAIRAARAG